MAGGGWVKFHRQIEKWEWYQDGNTFRLFFHLVMKANHEEKKWQGITIERGQRVTSYSNLAFELKITERQARTALEHLKMTGEVSVKTTNKYTVITINNYAKYQAFDEEEPSTEDEEVTGKKSGKKSDGSQANDRQEVSQTTTNKNDKEDKNDKKEESTESAAAHSPIPYQEIIDLYISLCPGLPKVKLLTDNRRNTIRARWNTCRADPLGHFTELFTKAGKSDFLAGINDRAWIADFDWLMKEQNAAKVIEGKYDNSARAPAGLKRQPYAPQETQQQKNARIIQEMIAKEQAKEAGHGNEAGNVANNRDIEFSLSDYKIRNH